MKLSDLCSSIDVDGDGSVSADADYTVWYTDCIASQVSTEDVTAALTGSGIKQATPYHIDIGQALPSTKYSVSGVHCTGYSHLLACHFSTWVRIRINLLGCRLIQWSLQSFLLLMSMGMDGLTSVSLLWHYSHIWHRERQI